MQTELNVSTGPAQPVRSSSQSGSRLADAVSEVTTGAAQTTTPWRRGSDFVSDLKRELPDFAPDIVFDVGANTGTTARRYAEEFPSARIYCFEPVEPTFFELQRNLGQHANCLCFPIGFGETAGIVNMLFDTAHPTRSRVLESNPETEETVEFAATVPATLQTIDIFCQVLGITQIGLLKVDTEGHDLKVLKGARSMLEQRTVQLIVVEAGMYAGNELHVPYADLCAYLAQFGFVLFGVYDQQREWKKNLPYLRRADLAFIASMKN